MKRFLSLRLTQLSLLALLLSSLAMVGQAQEGPESTPAAPAKMLRGPGAAPVQPQATNAAAPAAVDAGLAQGSRADADAVHASQGAPAAAPKCTDANLARQAIITGKGIKGPPNRAKDGTLAQEGSQWDGAAAVTYKDGESYLQLDLRAVHDVRSVLVQADNNDQYVFEASLDGETFTPFWVSATPEDPGLRTRASTLGTPTKLRYLRVRGRGGDGFYSVSELQLYCTPPKPFPPKLNLPPKKHLWAMLTNPLMVHVQAALATAGALILLLGFMVRYPLRPIKPHRVRDSVLLFGACAGLLTWFYDGAWWQALAGGICLLLWLLLRWAARDQEYPRKLAPAMAALCRPPASILMTVLLIAAVGGVWEKFGIVPACGAAWLGIILWVLVRMLRKPVALRTSMQAWLLVLGMLGLGSWWNYGHFHFNHHIHIWEQYHYFMGVKYGPELRYGRLYDCTTAGDLADGLKKRVEKRQVRQLATDNNLASTQNIIDNPGICTDHFSKERWEAFRKDLRFFRGRFSQDRWDKSQTDHGYNATPVWGLAARALVDRVGDLTWPKIEKLGAIDNALLLIMWAFAAWAFGFEPVMVAMMFWGFNYPGRYYWNGGGLLRYDWLLWLVVGLGLLRRKQNFLGGVALTYTTLLRVFPGFVVAALVLKALARMVRERRFVLSREHMAFAAGCLITLGTLIPASSWSMNGLDAWPEFVKNSEKHMETALTNNMGLKTVVAYDFATRASQMRNDKVDDPFKGWKDARRYFAHKRKPLFIAIVALFCLLLARAGDRISDWETACLGTGLIVISAELTCYYYAFLLAYGLMWERRKLPGWLSIVFAAGSAFMDRIGWLDDRYTLMSLAAVLMVVISTAHIAFGKRIAAEETAA